MIGILEVSPAGEEFITKQGRLADALAEFDMDLDDVQANTELIYANMLKSFMEDHVDAEFNSTSVKKWVKENNLGSDISKMLLNNYLQIKSTSNNNGD